MTTIDFYTIYKNPTDFPGKYVVRKRSVSHGNDPVLHGAIAVHTLDAARAYIPHGLTNVGRYEGDDPVIVETWV